MHRQALQDRGPGLLLDKCLPYQAADRGDKPVEELCEAARQCGDASALVGKGSFAFKPLDQPYKVMKHIREYGAVVSG